MTTLAPYQTRLDRASDIRPGDFLDVVEPNRDLRGPRGGKYRYDGARVESRVLRVAWIVRDRVAGLDVEFEPNPDDPIWRPLRADGFKIVPATGAAFVLPGNLADLTGAIVRRKGQ